MADAWGVDDGYWDVGGTWHDTTDDTRRALRLAMGGHADVEDPPPRSRPVWLVRHGTAPPLERLAHLVLEDGTTVDAAKSIPPDLPLGYHDLHPSDGGISTRLIVTPGVCHLPPDLRAWGWTVQAYAARSKVSWGIGDLGDLGRLAAWSAGLGAGVLGVSPLNAALPLPPQQPSPYFPSSRRFHDPLYVAVESVPGFDPDDPALAKAQEAGRALNAQRHIDRDRVLDAKIAALEHLWAGFGGDPDFDAYRREQGDALRQFTAFTVLTEHHRSPWHRWPAEHRRPESPGVGRFAAANADRLSFHAWIQWLLDRQLAAAAAHLALIVDLPVGVDPDGADAWVWQDSYAHGARVGAPPDEFNVAGQDWGVPPFVPWKLRAAGYEPFARTLRAALRHASGVRIDHVMGLFRLYWVPPGADPAAGAYVRYPAGELLEVVALESVRAGAFVVGEDLGTVEDEVRDRLRAADVLSYRLVWFEREPPERFPEQSFAAVTTHDLPTIPGLWTGADVADQEAAGVTPNLEGTAELRQHLIEIAGVTPDAPVDAVVQGTYRGLAAAPSMVVAAVLEDPLGVEERPNLPGTVDERPNWCLALPVPLEDVERDPRVHAVAAALGRRPGRTGP
jgi:4-alpha-glucanotransferase